MGQADEREVRREEGQGRTLMRGLGLPGEGVEQVIGLCSATAGAGGRIQNQRHRVGGYCVRVTIEGMTAKRWPNESSWCVMCQWTEWGPEAAGAEAGQSGATGFGGAWSHGRWAWGGRCPSEARLCIGETPWGRVRGSASPVLL